jgi:hypothetical protein
MVTRGVGCAGMVRNSGYVITGGVLRGGGGGIEYVGRGCREVEET